MPRSKTSNEDREVPHFPGLAKASAAAPTSDIDKPSGSASTLDPQVATAGASTSISPPAKSAAPPSIPEANPIGSIKSGSKLRNQLSPSDLEHDGDATPTTSMKPSIKIKMRNPYALGFVPPPYRDHDKEDDEDYDDLDASPPSRAKPANIPPNPYEGKVPDPQNPGNRPHDRWEAISVHTAKCDECQGHNRKVVQRCKSCNLQFCQTCLEIVLQDGQHFAAATPFDWTPKPMIRSKRTNAATKKAKATAASRAPKRASPAPDRRPSERVLAGGRKQSTIPAEDDTIEVEVPRGRQHQRFVNDEYSESGPSRRPHFDDDEEYNMGGPRKSKRQFIDPEDDDMEPKKSRRTGEHDPTYYGDEMGEDLQEVEDEVRYGHERRRPRDPEKVGRSSYRQGVGRTAQPTGFGSSGIRHGPSEYLESSSRPSSQTGRPHVMTHQESFQAAWEQIQETKRKAQQAAEREEQWIEARKNPVVRKLLEEGRDDDVEALLDAAALLREMGRSTQ